MTEHEFTDLLGGIDPALIARAEARVPVRKKQSFRRTVIILAAALLVLSTLLSVAAIASFPKTYDLDYEIPKHEYANKIAQIYYAEDGKIKKQNVLLPPTAENIFMTWQHLNGLEDKTSLIEIVSTEGAYPDRQVVMTLSTELRDHPESETLLDSLQKTFAQYFVMRAENISFVFADQTIEDVGLHFYYLPSVASSPPVPGGRIVVTVGMTNVSDQDIVFEGAWSDFAPRAKLLEKSIIYVANYIFPELNDSTTEIAEYRLAPGQSREVTYMFHIPEQAADAYDLIVSFGDQSYTFENFVSFTELSKQVVFTNFMYDDFVYTLSAQQCEQFVFMLERAERIADTVELECDSSGTVGNSSFKYDSKTGVLLLDGCTYTLTEQDRLKLNVMVSGTVHLNFDPSAIVEVNSPYDDITHYATLSEAHRDRIIAILNDGNWGWLPGSPNVQPGDHTLTFWDADTPLDKRDRIEYHSETGLFVYNEYYLNISNADRLAVNDIFSGYAVQRPDT